jgi:tRNA dimethylallyltransferase
MNASRFDLSDCWFLSGPTASGKTAVALELAEQLGAEIVSMDSMAVYRHMDLGTAKPTGDQRRRVAHHVVDIVDPNQPFSLAQYLQAAQSSILAIRTRGRVPLIVGGTPLYLKALLRGIFSGPPADHALRQRLADLAEQQGNLALHQRLAAVDPDTARRLAPDDRRRVIRALEVLEITGQSITLLQTQFERPRNPQECRVFVLNWNRDELIRRIEARVDQMFQMGLVDETSKLLTRYGALSPTAGQAVGYREVISHLSGGPNLLETIGLVKTRTRQLAKRQMTWFRSLCECQFLQMGGSDSPRQIARLITPQK